MPFGTLYVEDLKQRQSSCKITKRKVVRRFFFKRKKTNLSKKHDEYFYEPANGKQCLHQVSWKNIVKTDYLHESSYIQQLYSVKPKVIDYTNSGHAYYRFPNKPSHFSQDFNNLRECEMKFYYFSNSSWWVCSLCILMSSPYSNMFPLERCNLP